MLTRKEWFLCILHSCVCVSEWVCVWVCVCVCVCVVGESTSLLCEQEPRKRVLEEFVFVLILLCVCVCVCV